MTKTQVETFLHFAGEHLEATPMFRDQKIATEEFLCRLENHCELIAELLTREEQAHGVLKFKLITE